MNCCKLIYFLLVELFQKKLAFKWLEYPKLIFIKQSNIVILGVAALGVHALSTLDTPTLAAVIIGSILCVVSALTAYALYTCRKREQLRQEDLLMRQQTYEGWCYNLHSYKTVFKVGRIVASVPNKGFIFTFINLRLIQGF